MSDIVDDDVMVVLSLLRGKRGCARFIIVALGSSTTKLLGGDDESMAMADGDNEAAVAAVADFPVAAKWITLMDGCSLRVLIRPGDGTDTCWVGCLASALSAAAVEELDCFRRRKAEEICFMVEVVEVE